MKESISFYYDGISSEEMGLYNVSFDSGFYEESFLAERRIEEVSIRGREKPYFQGVTRSPLALSLSFAFKDTYDDQKIREVARWLDQEYYKPFYTTDNEDRVWYCMLNSNPRLLHNGLKEGYIQLEFRCDSPYTYTPMYTSQVYDMSANSDQGIVISFTNEGDVSCFPEIWIEKVDGGDFSIVNNTTGKEFKFTGLVNGELVNVNSYNQIISTSLPATYRYDVFNNNYLEFLRGVNRLTVKGKAKFQFRYFFRTLQG